MRSERSPLPIRPLRSGRVLGGALAAVLFLDARRQHLQRLGLVAVLAAVVLALGDDAGRDVRDAHRRVGLVDVLAAGAAGAVGVDAQVGRVDLHRLRLVGLGQHGDRAGAGVDAALGLGGRHALHAVAAGFEAQLAEDLVADDAHHHFLVAAELALAFAHDLAAPARRARHSACTCAAGRRRTAPIRRRRCRRGFRGRRCARRPGPWAAAGAAARPRAAAARPRRWRSPRAPSRPCRGRRASRARRPGRASRCM